MIEKPICVKEVQSEKPDTYNDFSQIDTPKMCAVLFIVGKNFFYARPKLFEQMKRRVLIDTGSCGNALLESLFKNPKLNNAKFIDIGKRSFNSNGVWSVGFDF